MQQPRRTRRRNVASTYATKAPFEQPSSPSSPPRAPGRIFMPQSSLLPVTSPRPKSAFTSPAPLLSPSLPTVQAVETAPPATALTSADHRRDALAAPGLSPKKRKKRRVSRPSQSDVIAPVPRRHILGAPIHAGANNALDESETPVEIKLPRREYVTLHISGKCLSTSVKGKPHSVHLKCKFLQKPHLGMLPKVGKKRIFISRQTQKM